MQSKAVQYAYRVHTDALSTLLAASSSGEDLTPLHDVSHPAWLERNGVSEASLSELFDVAALRAAVGAAEPLDAEQEAWVAGARAFLARTESLHLWGQDRDAISARADRVTRLTEMGAPGLILANDRLMLAKLLAEVDNVTNSTPPPTPERLLIEAISGPTMSLTLPWLTPLPTAPDPGLSALGGAPAVTNGVWGLHDLAVTHCALVAGDELERWTNAVETMDLSKDMLQANGLEFLRIKEPDASEARVDEGGERLREFLVGDLAFLARRVRDAGLQGWDVLTWTIDTTPLRPSA